MIRLERSGNLFVSRHGFNHAAKPRGEPGALVRGAGPPRQFSRSEETGAEALPRYDVSNF
jgi:hypothetical protein